MSWYTGSSTKPSDSTTTTTAAATGAVGGDAASLDQQDLLSSASVSGLTLSTTYTLS